MNHISDQMNASMSLMANLKNNQKVNLHQRHNHKVKLHLKKVQKETPSERVPFSSQITHDMLSELPSSCRPGVRISQMDEKTKQGRSVGTSSPAELARGTQIVLEPSSTRVHLPEIQSQLLDSWLLGAKTLGLVSGSPE
jgi:hypothetical protein